MPKRQVVGVVTSDKMNKSRRVEIERLVQHKRYGKFMRRRTVCHVHDENNESHEGDTVEIIEAPPRSKLKRWDLLRIVTRSQQVDIAAMRAAAEINLTSDVSPPMIQMQTRLNVADNTGAKEVMCIKVLGGTRRRTAGLGDIVICSVKSVIPGSDVNKKSVVKGVV